MPSVIVYAKLASVNSPRVFLLPTKLEPMKLPTATKLKQLGGHLGHLRRFLHPSFRPYVEAIRDKLVFIDLKKAVKALKEAVEFLKKNKKARVLWVGTKPAVKDLVKTLGEELGHPYVAEKWLGGMLTNFETLKRNLEHLESLKKEKKKKLKEMTKKEKRILDQKIARLEKYLSGLKDLKDLPEIIIVVDPFAEETAVKEAKRKGIKIVAICDVSANLWDIDYPIPLNDESRLALKEVLTCLARVFAPKFSFPEETKK